MPNFPQRRWCRCWFYPAIELAALLVPCAALAAGAAGWWLWSVCGLGWALLAVAWIDARHFVLPDGIVLPLLLAGLVVCWLRTPWAIYNHALAAALGYGGFRGLDMVYTRIRGHAGLGAGDAKLLGAAGAWAGLAALPVIVLGAGVLGLAVALPQRKWRTDDDFFRSGAGAGELRYDFRRWIRELSPGPRQEAAQMRPDALHKFGCLLQG
jgi:prepilin signal peptidase PulO-like enzyme (type II secretory pathway)